MRMPKNGRKSLDYESEPISPSKGKHHCSKPCHLASAQSLENAVADIFANKRSSSIERNELERSGGR